MQQANCSEGQIRAHENESVSIKYVCSKAELYKLSLCCLLGGAEASPDKLKRVTGQREHLLSLLLASITQIKSYERQHHAEDIRYRMKAA